MFGGGLASASLDINGNNAVVILPEDGRWARKNSTNAPVSPMTWRAALALVVTWPGDGDQ